MLRSAGWLVAAAVACSAGCRPAGPRAPATTTEFKAQLAGAKSLRVRTRGFDPRTGEPADFNRTSTDPRVLAKILDSIEDGRKLVVWNLVTSSTACIGLDFEATPYTRIGVTQEAFYLTINGTLYRVQLRDTKLYDYLAELVVEPD